MDQNKVQLTQEVIDGINAELNYQNSLPGTDRADLSDNGLAGQLVSLGTYAAKARDAWTLNGSNEPALQEIRKCAAICARALVRFGRPPV